MTAAMPIDYPRDRRAPTRGINGNIRWTDALDGTLRILWVAGWSTAEIARRMSSTKNAIVGRAHRIGLPGRPSPLGNPHRGGSRPMSHPTPRPPVPTLAELTAQPPRHEPGRYPRRVWTPEQDARLTELRAQGVPFWNCGQQMGLSRQACQERWRAIAPAAAPAEPPQPVAAPVAVAVAPEQPEPLAGATGRGGCLYPLWGDGRPTHRYCAAAVAVAGAPYCGPHMRLTHQRAP